MGNKAMINSARIMYPQMPNKRPPCLLIFCFFPTSRTLLGPPFINFKEIDFLYKPFISFPFFVNAIYSQFSRQNRVLLYIFWFYAL